MAYKIQKLVESGYDFTKVYTEKQAEIRDNTGLAFDFDMIVKFLQRQTNNFTIDNKIAHDLDDAIYNCVVKFEKENKEEIPEMQPEPEPEIKEEIKPEPESKETPQPEKTEEEKRQEILEAIELLEMLGDDADDEAKEALEILKTLI